MRAAVARWVAECDVVHRIGHGEHMCEVLKDSHVRTWISQDGGDRVAEATQGTKAGDPYGDLMFNHVMHCVLVELAR
eukprot:15057297-Alexandrium_andersonii.AAC.1